MLVAYISLTGNVRSFVDKLSLPGKELDFYQPLEEIVGDFVLVIPSYSAEVTNMISTFLEYQNNKQYLKGVAGSGSLNYNSSYCFNAREIATKYEVPLIHTFEFNGRDNDVEKFLEGVNKLGITETDQ